MNDFIPTNWDDDLATQIDKVLEDLLQAESWPAMAARSVTRSTGRSQDLVRVPVRRGTVSR